MSDISDKFAHVYWDMHWGPQFPEKPPIERMFEAELALSHLLYEEVVFINSHWWEKDWPQEAKDSISINVNCNDIFAWACADAEPLLHKDIQSLYDHWIKDPDFGAAVWCIKQRNMMPQNAVYDAIQKAGKWDLDTMEIGKKMITIEQGDKV